MTFLRTLSALLILTLMAACAPAPTENGVKPGLGPGTPGEIAALAAEIRGLGPEVDPEEAQRAARIAYGHTFTLAKQYQITDGPLIHNTKVNMGTKPRGLCWHWAHDMEKRLKQERFQTLDLHRAIANSQNWRLEHSTAIISARGDDFTDGIVLDPWRKGGVLTWMPVRDDTRYGWEDRRLVLERKRGLLPPEAYDAAIE
ncbi:hypothetical protein D6850_15665 [Roseovarius spongiae]|uniref:Lipoprotein n=1 Tax=Roseovarius spongiae TaxID=2320272 RepID=A0A3A8B7P0_9RHOB|nr:hypothetical protein [Roseovarius spongiae]RKF12939.1 hypothetical protein D6850_15665 [Roseovarius spongiae]